MGRLYLRDQAGQTPKQVQAVYLRDQAGQAPRPVNRLWVCTDRVWVETGFGEGYWDHTWQLVEDHVAPGTHPAVTLSAAGQGFDASDTLAMWQPLVGTVEGTYTTELEYMKDGVTIFQLDVPTNSGSHYYDWRYWWNPGGTGWGGVYRVRARLRNVSGLVGPWSDWSDPVILSEI